TFEDNFLNIYISSLHVLKCQIQLIFKRRSESITVH
ncbi:hypothetical protein X975_19794, partial [Stegodyphus mimosarum]